MLYLIRGLPGSGKSTFCYKKLNGILHLEADMYFQRGGYNYNPKNIKTAHEWCLLETTIALKVGIDVAVSNTFTKYWQLEPYIDYCNKYDIQYKIIRCTGKYKNVHNVPPEIMEKMKAEFENIPNEILV